MTLPITPGRYKTRDGREALVQRVGQAIAIGLIGSRIEEWSRINGKWGLGFDADEGRDLVERIGDL